MLKLRADALTGLTRFDEALEAYAAAEAAANTLGYRAVLWKVLRNWSALQFRTGMDQEAIVTRNRAQNVVTEISRSIERPDVRGQFQHRANDSLPRLVSTPARPANRFGLSDRQLEVLALVASGMTDAQVGQELYISPRTVARHLQTIYARLSVNSRTAAVTMAYEHDLIEPRS